MENAVTRYSKVENMARERGALVVSFEQLANYPDAKKVVFSGHGNYYIIGRKGADELVAALEEAGLRPEIIELAGCQTGRCPAGVEGALTRLGAWMLGAKPLAQTLSNRSGAQVYAYLENIYPGGNAVFRTTPLGRWVEKLDLGGGQYRFVEAEQVLISPQR